MIHESLYPSIKICIPLQPTEDKEIEYIAKHNLVCHVFLDVPSSSQEAICVSVLSDFALFFGLVSCCRIHFIFNILELYIFV